MDVGRRQGSNRGEAFQRRLKREDRVFSGFTNFSCDELATNVRRLVVALIRIYPPHGDWRLAGFRKSIAARQLLPHELLLEVIYLARAPGPREPVLLEVVGLSQNLRRSCSELEECVLRAFSPRRLSTEPLAQSAAQGR